MQLEEYILLELINPPEVANLARLADYIAGRKEVDVRAAHRTAEAVVTLEGISDVTWEVMAGRLEFGHEEIGSKRQPWIELCSEYVGRGLLGGQAWTTAKLDPRYWKVVGWQETANPIYAFAFFYELVVDHE